MKVWQPTDKEISTTDNWSIWSKEISEFPWFYDDTETCLILDCEAEVTDSNGGKISFRKGDMVKFNKSVKCTWKITKHIRKRYFFS